MNIINYTQMFPVKNGRWLEENYRTTRDLQLILLVRILTKKKN